MTPEEIKEVVKEAVSEAMAIHPCWMSEEDRAMVRDMVTGGKYVKKSFLMALAGGVIYAIAKVIIATKAIKF